jgi:hypothetical protein
VLRLRDRLLGGLQNPCMYHVSLVLGCTCACTCACITMIISDQISVGLSPSFDVLEEALAYQGVIAVQNTVSSMYACMYYAE